MAAEPEGRCRVNMTLGIGGNETIGYGSRLALPKETDDLRGYFCREPYLPHIKFAFTNYGVSVGLQAVGARPERVQQLNVFFDSYRSGDEYDRAAITHVMACSSRYPGQLLALAGGA
jgi:hypothetical protein